MKLIEAISLRICSICKSVNMDIIVKICKGLGISLKEFFRGEVFELQNLEVD